MIKMLYDKIANMTDTDAILFMKEVGFEDPEGQVAAVRTCEKRRNGVYSNHDNRRTNVSVDPKVRTKHGKR